MRLVLLVGFFLFVNAGCQKAGDTAASNEPPTDPAVLKKCNQIFTIEAINKFNASQSNFRVLPTGATSTCSIKRTSANGTTEMKKEGSSHIVVLPQVDFMSSQPAPGMNGQHLIRGVFLEQTPNEDLRKLVQSLDYQIDEGDVLPIVNDMVNPIYFRFQKGSLFSVRSFRQVQQPSGSKELNMVGAGYAQDVSQLDEKMQLMNQGRAEIFNLLWLSPDSKFFYSQSLDPFRSGGRWQTLRTEDVLVSLVKENDRLGVEHIELAIALAGEGLDYTYLNLRAPELYGHAEFLWRESADLDSRIQRNVMLYESALRYLVRVSNNHRLAGVAKLYSELREVTPSKEQALGIARRQASPSRLYDDVLFSRVLDFAKRIPQKYASNRWEIAEKVVAQFRWDENRLSLFLELVSSLEQVRFDFNGNSSTLFNEALNLIEQGLTKGQLPVYVRALDLYQTWRFSDEESWSLAKKKIFAQGFSALSEVNSFAQVVEDINKHVYDPKSVVQSLDRYLDQLKPRQWVGVFPGVVDLTNYFRTKVYFSGRDALETALEVVTEFPTGPYTEIQTHMDWLLGDFYVPRSEVVEKLKNHVRSSRGNLLRIREFTQWIQDKISFGKRDALAQAEDVLPRLGFSSENVQVFQTTYEFIYRQTSYGVRNSFEKVQNLSEKGLTKERSEQLQALFSVLYRQLNLSTNRSLDEAIYQVFDLPFQGGEYNVFIQWLDMLYRRSFLNSTNSWERVKAYRGEKTLTTAMFQLFQETANKKISEGKSLSVALAEAETRVFGKKF